MDFALSTEQEDLRAAIRRFVDERSPLSAVREAVKTDAGHDTGLWSRMSRDLDLPGLLVPEKVGGSGATMVDAAIVAEELGRGLVPSPYFATVALGVIPLLATEPRGLGAGVQADVLTEVAAGKCTLTTALTEPGAASSLAPVSMRASEVAGRATLTGTKIQVIDGHTADRVIVVAVSAETEDRYGLYLVDGGADGLTRTKVETLDLTRPMATLNLDGVSATRLGDLMSWSEVQHMLDRSATLLAAEMVGGLEGAMTLAVEYAKVRHQFERPIGSFQAIKHRCAEMAVELDASRAASLYAAHLASTDDPGLATAAPVALATAAAGFTFAASWNIQIHGGIGFTWEHDAHLYYRRAKADEVLFGSPRQNWLALADRLGI